MNDGLPLLFVGLFALFFIVAIGVAVARNQRVNDEWRQFADQVGGEYQPSGLFQSRAIRMSHRGYPVLVDVYSTGGKHPTYYTQLRLPWPEANFRLEVYPDGVLSSFRKFFGMQDIEIGSPGFDNAYIITGSSRDEVREFLNPSAQQVVSQLRSLWGTYEVYVSVVRGQLLVKKRQLARTRDELEQLVSLCTELFDSAADRISEGIEFTTDVTAKIPESVVCQVCGDEITSNDNRVRCRRCKTPHHRDCWTYFGACSTYGCGGQKFIGS